MKKITSSPNYQISKIMSGEIDCEQEFDEKRRGAKCDQMRQSQNVIRGDRELEWNVMRGDGDLEWNVMRGWGTRM